MFAFRAASAIKGIVTDVIDFANDPNLTNVKLLLHGEGTNGATYPSFTDSSSNAYVPSAASGTVTVSNARSKFGSSSLAFTAGSFRYTASLADFNLNTGDFTIEMWVYFTNVNTLYRLVQFQNGGGATNYAYGIHRQADGTLRGFVTSTAGTNTNVFGPSVPAANTWHHIAFVRNGTTITMFLNGVPGTPVTGPANGTINSLANGLFMVGADMDGSNSFTGNIDELRVTKGVARYANQFVVPAVAFPSPSNLLGTILGTERLVLQGEGNSIDSSANAATITNTAVTYATTAPFAASGTSSMVFNGTSSFLQTPSSTNYVLSSTADWTVDFYYYTPSTLANLGALFTSTNNAGATNIAMYQSAAGKYSFNYWNGSANTPIGDQGTALVNGLWRHYAVTYTASTKVLRVYVNGVLDFTTTISTFSTAITPATMNIGRNDSSLGGSFNYYLKGNIDRFRVTPSVRWTANFYPDGESAMGLTYGTEGFILTGDGTNGSTTIVDSSLNNHTIDNSTTINTRTNTQMQNSTARSARGTGSIYTNGGFSVIPSSGVSTAVWMAGNADWTFDCFVYMTALPAASSYYEVFFLARNAGSNWNSNYVCDLVIGSNGKLLGEYADGSAAPPARNGANAIPINTWTHIAVTWNSTSKDIKFWINGALDSTFNIPAFTTNSPFTGRVTIGRTDTAVTTPDYQTTNLYIDRARQTPSQRWTANFTPD